jgi:hypothetical protein
MKQYNKIILTALLCMVCMMQEAVAQGFLYKIGSKLDSMAIKGVDRNYIDLPKQPWAVVLKGNVNRTDFKMRSVIDHAEQIDPDVKGPVLWEPRVKTDPSFYAGLWVGYRGIGFGYSHNVGGDKGHLLTFNAVSSMYGANLRIHNFETDEPKVTMTGNFRDEETGEFGLEPQKIKGKYELITPLKVRTLTLDGYYLFNGKRFSYVAAYDQTVTQKRSAGSFMAGAMYHHTTMKFNGPGNADLVLLMDDIGVMKQWLVSVGGGYGYNWVPCKGLLVNAMAMPMIAVYNRSKSWRYNSEFRERVIENPEMEDDDILLILDSHLVPITEPDPLGQKYITTKNSRIRLVADTRMSISYHWSRFFVNANGSYYYMPYKTKNFKSSLADWYINASVGVRF